MKFQVEAKYDVIVLGTGVSGLICALELAKQNKSVCILTKEAVTESSSLYAQGGIAIPLSKGDSVEKHLEDTIKAGAGLVDPILAREIISYSGIALEKLLSYGVKFDTSSNGIHQTQEAAHSIPRVCHIGGDATGKYLTKILIDKVCRDPKIFISQGTVALSILKQDEARYLAVLVEDVTRNRYVLASSHLIIATGGAGQLYKETTNPKVCTGDGITMAFRAGIKLRDMEFIQFHPTVLLEGGEPVLITEAIRGEGGLLKNIKGEYFAKKYHEHGELAPRDVLARAIFSEMQCTDSKYVYLDVSKFDKHYFEKRFPTVYKSCTDRKIKLFQKGIPVTPAAHYFIGGISSDLYGRTDVDNIWVVGEVACCGFHGANRLASNSLLECITVPHFLVKKLLESDIEKSHKVDVLYINVDEKEYDENKLKELVYELQSKNISHIGLVRSGASLTQHLDWLKRNIYDYAVDLPSLFHKVQEVKNMLLLSYLICYLALERKHSIGVHYRDDFRNPVKEPKSSFIGLSYNFDWRFLEVKHSKPVSIS